MKKRDSKAQLFAQHVRNVKFGIIS